MATASGKSAAATPTAATRLQDLLDCCSRDWLQSLPIKAAAMLEASEIKAFTRNYPEHRERLASEVRALQVAIRAISKTRTAG